MFVSLVFVLISIYIRNWIGESAGVWILVNNFFFSMYGFIKINVILPFIEWFYWFLGCYIAVGVVVVVDVVDVVFVVAFGLFVCVFCFFFVDSVIANCVFFICILHHAYIHTKITSLYFHLYEFHHKIVAVVVAKCKERKI